MKTVCPSCRRIPKKIRSKRAIHAVRTRTKYIIAKTQPWCNYKTFKFSQHTKKSTRVSPSACALPDAAHAKRALFPPKLAFGKEVGQACRSRPRKIPHKSPALPDFYTSARAAAARPPLPCRGVGGIVFGFSGTENVSRGDSVPPWTSRQRIKFVIVRCPVSGGSMPALSMTLSIHAMLRPSFSMTSTPSVSCMASPFSAP